MRKYPEGESPRERIIAAARTLFGSKGFHATTTDELTSAASVSVGLLYRHFARKEDIILAIAEENARNGVAEMHGIFDAVERGELAIAAAIEAIAQNALREADAALFLEIVAESCRNPQVAERLGQLTNFYRVGVRRLAILARPDAARSELDACVDLMEACFIGLSYRAQLVPRLDADAVSRNTARLIMRALALDEGGTIL